MRAGRATCRPFGCLEISRTIVSEGWLRLGCHYKITEHWIPPGLSEDLVHIFLTAAYFCQCLGTMRDPFMPRLWYAETWTRIGWTFS